MGDKRYGGPILCKNMFYKLMRLQQSQLDQRYNKGLVESLVQPESETTLFLFPKHYQ